MQTEEEKLEVISIELLITLDILLVSKAHVGPFLAIRTKVYDDGGTKEYYGLGYKVIKYNQKIGRRDTIIGSWSIKYDTTPTNYTLEDLAFSIINDNNNHIDEFIRLTGTIKKVDKSNKTLTLTYEDADGKYNLTVKAEVISETFKFNENAPVSIIGIVNKYDNKTITISNAFAE